MAQQMPGLRILIVDDEPLIRWSMAETLGQAGHHVTEAGTAKEALQRLSVGPIPDVIVLDYRLPDSNDLGLLKSIREVAPWSPIIMMTAYGTPALQSDTLDFGVYRVIEKPIDMKDLTPLVENAHATRTQ
jgi:DNA-binding NtrC family response regulator